MLKFLRSILLIPAVLLITLALASCGSDSVTASTSYLGTWKAVTSTEKNTSMVAVITDNNIVITINTPDTEALYWKGTFPATEAKDGDKLISQADTEALDKAILGSQDATKEFTYQNGELSFSMSMMGVKKTIHLTK